MNVSSNGNENLPSFSNINANGEPPMELGNIGLDLLAIESQSPDRFLEDCKQMNVLPDVEELVNLQDADLQQLNTHDTLEQTCDGMLPSEAQDYTGIPFNNETHSNSQDTKNCQALHCSKARSSIHSENFSSLPDNNQWTCVNISSNCSGVLEQNSYINYSQSNNESQPLTFCTSQSYNAFPSCAEAKTSFGGVQHNGSMYLHHQDFNQTQFLPYSTNAHINTGSLKRSVFKMENETNMHIQKQKFSGYRYDVSKRRYMDSNDCDKKRKCNSFGSFNVQEKCFSSSSGSRNTSHDTDISEISEDANSETSISSTATERGSTSKKTKYNEKWGVKVLKDWCSQNNITVSFSDISPERLNELLLSFWKTVRKASGEPYGRNSLFNLRAMISKFFKKMRKCNTFDIATDIRFKTSNDYLDMLVKAGNKIKHKVPISLQDMWQLYQSGVLGLDNAEALMQKVWFEITLYFHKRGSPSQDKLIRDSFKISRDEDGRRFLEKNVPLETNGKVDATRMYETGGNLCPLYSFERYIDKLHPEQDRLFQKPRKKHGEVWYGKSPIGEKTLQSMMRTLSQAANLSNTYTNHCVRTTPSIRHHEMLKRVAQGRDPTKTDDCENQDQPVDNKTTVLNNPPLSASFNECNDRPLSMFPDNGIESCGSSTERTSAHAFYHGQTTEIGYPIQNPNQTGATSTNVELPLFYGGSAFHSSQDVGQSIPSNYSSQSKRSFSNGEVQTYSNMSHPSNLAMGNTSAQNFSLCNYS